MNQNEPNPMPIFSHQRHVIYIQRGHLIQKYHFCYMPPKYLAPHPTKIQEREVVGHAIGHTMFVPILGLGVIVGLGNTFWE